MSKRRTRSSSRQDERKFICRFERCTVSLATELQREVHEKTHQADKPLQCEESACNERFATSTEYEEHGKIAHLRRRSKRRKTNNGGALLAYDDVHHEKQEIHGEDGEVEVPDFDTVKDANEIVENAVYLASQMRIARVRYPRAEFVLVP